LWEKPVSLGGCERRCRMSIRVLGRKELPIEELVVPDEPLRSRSTVSKTTLTALARNIQAEGLLENILVTNDSGSKPTIVAGYRRYLACRMANVKQVPVTVIEVDDDFDRRMAELSENMCREDLDDVDLALSLSSLKELYEEKHPECAHGGNRRRPREPDVMSFVDYMSELMGCGTTKLHDLLVRAQAYREHPDWADAVKKDQMTPASVMRLWRYMNRRYSKKPTRRHRSLFRAREMPESEGRRITLVVVADDGDPGKRKAMEAAITAWWRTTSKGRAASPTAATTA